MQQERTHGPLVRTPVSLPLETRKGTYVVIAAFNEEATIGGVLGELLAAGFPHVVVVDDGSSDRTRARARAGGAITLRHVINRGQGAALQTGIAYAVAAGADVIVTFDADGQHCADDVPYLVEPIASGRAAIALGSRFAGRSIGMPRGRRWLLHLGRWFTFLSSGVLLSDTHNGVRAFSREAAQGFDIRLDRMAHASELIDQVRRTGLAWVEVPVRVRYTAYSRAKGQRSWSALRIALDYLLGKWLR
jgi:glycosyltransferase involved in cell wall biosynthesis